jgi:drug/metabolite transporter (DMT)-like permease
MSSVAIRAMPVVFVLIWSTGFVVARLAMPHAPPFGFLAMRFALSAACFALWMRFAGVAWPRDRRQLGHLAVTGVLMQAVYLGGVWAAVRNGLGAGTVALVVGLQPVLTAVWLSGRGDGAGGDAVVGTRWLGLALGFLGLGLVVWNKLGVGEMTLLNLAFGIAALIGITVGTLYQKRFVQPCDVRAASGVQMLAALTIALPVALLEPGLIDWRHPDFAIAMAWSVLVLTLGGSSLLYLLIQRGETTSVTSLLYLVPPCTAAMAWALFGEPVTLLMVAGMIAIAFGVALVMRTPRSLG